MRSLVRSSFLGGALLALGIGVACADDPTDGDLEPDNDAGQSPVRADAKTTPPDAAPPTSTMRFVHLAPELGPVDFCYQPANTGMFVGPVLGGPPAPKLDAAADADADANAAGDAISDASDARADARDVSDARADAAASDAPSLAYGTLTKYLLLEASGPITIAVIEAGATSCANPIVKGDVTLDPGKLATAALFGRPGDAGTELEIAAFVDDRTTADNKFRVRVIHAALGRSNAPAAGVLAVRANAAKTTVLADRVEPRKAATTSSNAVAVDSLGYVTAAPLPPPVTIAIGPASTDGGADAGFIPWVSRPADLGLTGGALHTAFVLSRDTLGQASAEDAGAGERRPAFEVLWCSDTITEGDHTVCGFVR